MTEKSKFLKRFNEAFATNDLDFILKSVSDNIVWIMVGDKTMEGKEAVKAGLEEMQHVQTLHLEISQIITHGKSAATHGKMKIKEVSGTVKAFGFSDFYEFTGFKDPKIAKMTSYVVPLE